jgi:hypothetical protein
MKRMQVLFGQRRMMVLVTLTILVLAAAALAASSASFTATSANPGNTFTAGTLSIFNSKDVAGVHQMVFSVYDMAPGDSQFATVTIGNNGSVSGLFTLVGDASGSADPGFAGYLHLNIVESGTGNTIYDGALDSFTTPQDLNDGNSWAPGGANDLTYTVTVSFPDADPTVVNGYMGDSATLALNWAAVSD